MSERLVTRPVTFKHRFTLPNMLQPHPPGTFDLVIENITLDVSWDAYRTSCHLMLVDGGTTSAIAVTIAEMEAALFADSQQDVNTGFS